MGSPLYIDNLWDDVSLLSGGSYAFGIPTVGRKVYVNQPCTIGLEFTLPGALHAI